MCVYYVNMNIYISIYIYINIWICVCVCIIPTTHIVCSPVYVRTCVRIHVCMYCVYIHTYLCVRYFSTHIVRSPLYACTCVSIPVCVYIYNNVYIYTYFFMPYSHICLCHMLMFDVICQIHICVCIFAYAILIYLLRIHIFVTHTHIFYAMYTSLIHII